MYILWRGTIWQRARLVSGLILFVFAATHFLNTALGLYSVDLMSTVQDWRTAITQSWVGTTVLAGAFLTHMALALAKLASRNTLRMSRWELAQIALGIAIPFLLAKHLVHARLSAIFFDVDVNYTYELLQLWPNNAWIQTALLLVVWVHGCIGLHFWLRLSPTYRAGQAIAFMLAVLVPAAALAGFMVGGREAQIDVSDPDDLAFVMKEINWPPRAALDWLNQIVDYAKLGFGGVLAVVISALLARFAWMNFSSRIAIKYAGGPTVHAFPGPSLLEISRMKRVPHLSICGGRGRCSTCRVQVVQGAENLSPVTPTERATLDSIGAPEGVRLACQARPLSSLTVIRILDPRRGQVSDAPQGDGESQGVERVLAVLFLDTRGFTRMSQGRLPYDVVFVLNQLFGAVVPAIERAGGTIDKYLGDGLMAIFGERTTPERACRQALQAAKHIDQELRLLNEGLSAELGEPLKIGIGIHVGPLVLGEIGYGKTASRTVIGKTVNAASRLEALTKEKQCQLIISADTAKLAGLDTTDFSSVTAEVRGISDPIDIVCIDRASDLPG